MKNNILSAVKFQGQIQWYRCPYEYWILNYSKRIKEAKVVGIEYPTIPVGFRGGILDLTKKNEVEFLDAIKDFEVNKDELSFELATRFKTADNYWDVIDIFPSIFMDFDRKHFDSVYDRGLRLDDYVPKNWTSSYGAFFYKYPDEVFPTRDKFWIKGDEDLFKILVERTDHT